MGADYCELAEGGTIFRDELGGFLPSPRSRMCVFWKHF